MFGNGRIRFFVCILNHRHDKWSVSICFFCQIANLKFILKRLIMVRRLFIVNNDDIIVQLMYFLVVFGSNNIFVPQLFYSMVKNMGILLLIRLIILFYTINTK
jgi:hypothetical protein